MYIKQSVFLINFLFLCSANLNAQFVLFGDKTFGGNNGDDYPKVLILNSQFYLAGRSLTDMSGDKTDALCYSQYGDIWVLKVDTSNNISWDKSTGGFDSEISIYSFLISHEGNLVFACRSNSDSSCEKSEPNWGQSNYWICVLDTTGYKIWDKRFGGTGGGEHVPRIVQLSSGNYILCGVSNSMVGGDKTAPNYGAFDYWVVKMDSTGSKIWDNVYGGTDWEYLNPFFSSAAFGLLAEGENFIIAGNTRSPLSGSVSDTSRGGYDIWIIKVDSSGNKIWDKRYGGSGADYGNDIIKTNDNGYLVIGHTESPNNGDVSESSRGGFDCWLLKLDSLGDKQWDKRYGSNNDDGGAIIKPDLQNGYYWISGYTNSDSSFEVSEPNYGAVNTYDFWIFKIDSIGNKIWDKRFGGPSDDFGGDFFLLPDSSFYLFGTADSGISVVKTDSGKGKSDYWLIHFKYSDNIVGSNSTSNTKYQLSLIPNPSNGIITLQSNLTGNSYISIYDLIGEIIYEDKITLQDKNTFDFSSFRAGLYFLKIENEIFSTNLKFIKQ